MSEHKTKTLIIGVTLLLAGHLGATFALHVSESDFGIPGWGTLPLQLAEWNSVAEDVLEPAVVEYLRPDDYLIRTYRSPDGQGSVNLFLAYFKSLQNSYGPHSPRVCLPGNGWLTLSSKIVQIPVPGSEQQIPANEFVLQKDEQHILVLYWYQNNRRIWAEEFQAKLHLLPDLLRFRRSDVTLVRIVVPITGPQARRNLPPYGNAFAQALFPLLVERLSTVQ